MATRVLARAEEGTELGRGHWCLHMLVLSEASEAAGQTGLECEF